MTNEHNSKGRTVGLILGWVALVVNVILLGLVYLDISTSRESITNPVFVFLGEFYSFWWNVLCSPFIYFILSLPLLSGLNLLACNSWLYGATFVSNSKFSRIYNHSERFINKMFFFQQHRVGYMLVSLIWWEIPAFFCIIFTIIGTFRGIALIVNENRTNDGLLVLFFGCVCMTFVAFHVATIFCFNSMRKANRRIQPNDTSAPEVVFTHFYRNPYQNHILPK